MARSSSTRRSSSGRRGGSKSSIRLPDMSKVEARVLLPENEYEVKVVEVTQEDGDKAPYLNWKFEVINDKEYDGAKLYFITSFAEKSLWNLKSLLECLDVEIPEGPQDLEIEELVDREMLVTVEHETWEGKKRAKIVDYSALEAEPAPARGRAKPDKEETSSRGERSSGRRKPPEKEPENEPLTQAQVNDMNQDELEDVIKEFDLDVDLAKHKTLRKMQAAVIDAAEEAKVLETEEPEPAPARGRRR